MIKHNPKNRTANRFEHRGARRAMRVAIAGALVVSLVTTVAPSGVVQADFAPDIFDPTTPGNTNLLDEPFSGAAGTVPAGWTSTPAGATGWTTFTAPLASGNAGNIPAADGGFIAHDDSSGNSATLLSPLIDLTAATTPVLTFDAHSYALTGFDGQTLGSTDKSYVQINVLDAAGNQLATVFELGDTDLNGADGWLDFDILLTEFIGQQVQLEINFVNGPNDVHDIALDNIAVADVGVPITSPILPPESVRFFLPMSAADIAVAHTHLRSNIECPADFGAQDTITELTAITIADTELDAAGNPTSAIILYDHIEDGFVSSISRQQITTEVWGDGDPTNGFPPGQPDDLLFPGEVIVLTTVSDPGVALQDDGAGGTEPAVLGAEIVGFDSTQQYDLNYDAGDRVTSATGLIVTRVGWNDGSSTLLAGAVEVVDTTAWGSRYELPIGEDLGTDAFEYVSASIMARNDGTVVTLPDGSTVTLDAGESYFINGGLNVGDVITSSGGSVSVNVVSGETCTGFEGRWFRLPPTRLFDDTYYSPVSGNGTTGGSDVFLYNPGAAPITVEVFDRNGLLTTVTVPAGSTVSVAVDTPDSGYRIEGSGEFSAFQLYDTDNTQRDWGFGLLGTDQLSPALQAGLAIGVDPTSGDTTTIASPIWISPFWGGTGPAPGPVQLCIDWNGDGGPLQLGGDPNNTYDTVITAVELEGIRLDEANNPGSNDLTGTKVFACNPANPTDPNVAEWLLTGAWGQDTTGPGGSPSIDVGTGILNLPAFSMRKDITNIEDDNGNGITDVGDTVQYTLTVTNDSGVAIRRNSLKIFDNLPTGLDYLEGTTFITPELAPLGGGSPELVPDDVGGLTEFPLDDGDPSNLLWEDGSNPALFSDDFDDGIWYNRQLDGGETITITFEAEILFVPTNNEVVNIAGVTDERFTKLGDVSFIIPDFITVGNRVWLDEDGDGVQDAGEDGIAGVPVTLTYDVLDNGVATTVVLETITDANGGYIFTDLPILPEGETYTVTISPPAGLDGTYEEDGSLDSTVVLTSDPFGTDAANPLALQPGEEHDTTDFGLNWVPPVNTDGTGVGAIGDTIWSDADGDGIQDPGEAGLGGVTVNLFSDPDGDGVYDTPAGTTTTDANGNYIFDDLPPGAYVVEVDPATLPAGVTQTGDPDGTLDNQSNPIPLAPGDVYVNADFGYTGIANTIGDTVWFDGNGDGIVDPDEPGFAGVTVVLLDSNGDVVATTITDANGNYSFTGVPDGDYQVWVNDTDDVLGDFAPISDPDGTLDGRTDVSVAGGQNADTADFGYAPPDADANEGLIGDTIFIDYDGDGVAGPGEGIEGVRVELFDEFGRLVGVTYTNENGQYAFGDLLPTGDGVYTIIVDETTLPAGLVPSVDPDGPPNNQSQTPLGDGEQIYDQDFGYVPADPASLSGTVWEDTDADGVLDPDEADRFEGVTIVLTETVTETVTVFVPDPNDPEGGQNVEITTTSERVVATTTTDADGNYSFDNLPPGDYVVRVSDDDNIVGGYWHSDAPAPGTDGQSQDDSGYPVTLGPGDTDSTADFGYYIDPGSVGNIVFDDANGNGILDPGEVGIPGATVALEITYPSGDTITLVTITSDGTTDIDGDGVIDPAGSYFFDNLLLDEDFNGDPATADPDEPTFEVSVIELPAPFDEDYVSTDPFGVTDGDDIGGDPTYDDDADDPDGTPAFPGQGVSDPTNDFGYVLEAELGGVVYEDLDGDGDQNGADPGIAGAEITITPPADVDLGNGPGVPLVVLTSDGTTDVDGDGAIDPAGSYYVGDLLPGDYEVEVTSLPDEYAQIEDPDAIIDSATTVTLPPGGSELENDFGYATPTLDIEKATNGVDADDPTGPFLEEGAAVIWTYTVENTGAIPVGVPTVTDNQGVVVTQVTLPNGLNAGDSNLDGVLDPGETWQFSGDGVATSGQYVNSAEAVSSWTDSTGTDQTVSSDEDLSHYFGVVSEIEIQKTVAAGAGAPCPGIELVSGSSGDPVTYCFEVENTGTVTLADVAITDGDLGIALADLTFVSGTALQGDGTLDLAPGESAVFSFNSTITGDLLNTAEATGTPIDDITDPANPVPFDPTVVDPPTAEDTAEVDEVPTFVVTKTNDADGDGVFTDTEPAQAAVSTVPFQVTISNDGIDPVTFTAITDAVGGVDRPLTDLACTLDSDGSVIAVGDSIPGGDAVTCTFSAEVDLTNAMAETDIISVDLIDDDDNTVTNDDDSTVTGEAAVIVDKTFVSATDADNDGIYDVVFTVEVSNEGTTSSTYDLDDTPGFDADLTIDSGSASVVTDGVNTPATPVAFTAPTWTLATGQAISPDETQTYTLTFVVDAATVLDDPTALSACDPAGAAAGQGFFNETTLTVAGEETPAEDCGDLLFPDISVEKLFVSAVDDDDDGVYTVTYTVEVNNAGTGTGVYSLDDTPGFDTDLVIGAGTATVSSNGANTPAAPGAFTAPTWTLATDEVIDPTETHTYTLVFDVDATAIANDPAVLSTCGAATPAAGEALFNEAELTYSGQTEQDDACGDLPLLAIDKSPAVISNDLDGDGEADLGDTLTYTITVTNSGGQPLTGVTVVDSIIPTITCQRADASSFAHVAGDDLAVGEVVTCTGDYEVVGTDVTAAEVENTATANSNETPPVDDTEVIPVPPAVTLVKDVAELVSLGGARYEITYTITVGNTGSEGTYSLTDELQFGAGIVIDSVVVANTVPGTITPNAGFNGIGDQVIIPVASPEVLAFQDTHVYTVTVQATADPAIVTPAALVCPPPGSGESGGFANTATVAMDDDTVADDACDAPEAIEVTVDKQVSSGPTLEADGTYTIVYDVVVTNQTSGIGTYDLVDELQFGGGITVLGAEIANVLPGTIATSATWDGLADTLAVDDGPIAALETHSFTVTVTLDALGLESPIAAECDTAAEPGPGGLLNTVEVTAAGDTDEADACAPVPAPDLNITKIVDPTSPTANADGTYDIIYTIEVSNVAEGPGRYDLIDDLAFGAGIIVNSAVVTSADVPDDLTGWTGSGTIVTGVDIAGLASDTYTVTVNASVPASVPATARDCTLDPDDAGATGFLNTADLVVGGEVADEADACVEAPPANIGVTKTIPADGFVQNADGTYSITYDLIVTNTGAGAGEYELDDVITFGDGITIDAADVVATDPAGLATNPDWDGLTDFDITTGLVALDGTDLPTGTLTHTYTITVTGDSSGLASAEDGDCDLTAGESGTGYLNTVTVTSDGVEQSDDACDPNPEPEISIDKALTSGPTLQADGTFAIEYTITVANTGGFGTYDLADEIQFGNGVTPVAGTESVTNTVPGDGTIEAGPGWVGGAWDGIASTTITTGQGLPAGGTHAYVVTVVANVDPLIVEFPTDAPCPPPGSGENGGFANTASITSAEVVSSDDACEPVPEPDLALTKNIVSGPTDLGDGTYSITYDVSIQNSGDGPDAYDLDDELRFGAGMTIVSSAVTNLLPGTIVTNPAWDGTGTTNVVTGEPIIGQATHTYQVTVVADAITVLTAADAECSDDGTLSAGGFLNVASIDSSSEVADANDCAELPLPIVTLAKGVATGPVEQAGNPGVYDITYDIVVTNTGAGSGRYDLGDDLQFGAGITVLSAAVASNDTATDLSAWTGAGVIVTDEPIAAGAAHTFTVTVSAQLDPATLSTDRDCTLDPATEDGTGLLNNATLSGPLVDIQEEDACAPLPDPDISIAKTVTSGPTLVGSNDYDITYDIVVTNAGLGVGQYDLSDDLSFGAGITVVSAAVTSADVATDLSAWVGAGAVTTGEAIAGTTEHTYTVTVRANVAAGTLPVERDCTVDPGAGGGSGLLNTAMLSTPFGDPVEAEACEPIPNPDLSIDKTVAAGPTSLGGDQFRIVYDIVVTNAGDAIGEYDLSDELTFGGGVTIDAATITSADVDVSGSTWDGIATTTVIDDVPIDATTAHTYTVTVDVTVASGIAPTDRDCALDPAAGEDGTGLLNTASMTVPGSPAPLIDDACGELLAPELTIEKDVASGPTLSADGTYTVIYDVVVTNLGDGVGDYDLIDEPDFGPAITIVSATAETADATLPNPQTWDPVADEFTIATGVPITAGEVDSYTLTFVTTVDAPTLVDTAGDCTAGPTPNTSEYFNSAEIVVDGVSQTDDACAPLPGPALEVTKTVSPNPLTPNSEGIYDVVYEVTVTNSGEGPGDYTLNDTFAFGDGVEVLDVEVTDAPASATTTDDFDGDTQPLLGTGELAAGASHVYTIAVRVNTGGVTVGSALDCTVDDGESGTGLLNTAVVGPDAAVPTAQACVEIPEVADLSLVKTVDQQTVTIGEAVTFTLTVTNGGPSTATGVTVADALPATLTYVSDDGAGAYDAASGIWTIGSIPVGESVSLSMVVTVGEGVSVNTAEVASADQPDPDSTPGNADPNEDDQDVQSVSGVRPELPETGSDAATMLRTGLGALVVGLLLAFAARRRRQRFLVNS